MRLNVQGGKKERKNTREQIDLWADTWKSFGAQRKETHDVHRYMKCSSEEKKKKTLKKWYWVGRCRQSVDITQ